MGPTAAGKTPLAIELVQQFPCEIISVDSAMVYRGLNIGTAKPTETELKIAPHQLIDIRDPSEIYSAGQFIQDVQKAIADIVAKQKIPLLVGGTMLYFRVLQQGLAALPQANPQIRALLQAKIHRMGIKALHEELAAIDPKSAQRIASNDSQRVQRALEVYFTTGKTISDWHQETSVSNYHFHNLILAPAREVLHQRIASRLQQMLMVGLIDEVKQLHDRGDLSPDLPAIRAVGYRQIWNYLENQTTRKEMEEKVLIATRQLAKRQMTWLRSWSTATWFSGSDDLLRQVLQVLRGIT